jgi:transposase
MPAPVPVPIRQALWDRHQRGATAPELAEAFGLPARTVRDILRRGRLRGREGLAPHRRAPAPRPEHPARAAALLLRREHPAWGAGLIRVMLKRQGIEPLPAARTIQRWVVAAGLGPATPGRRPARAARARAGSPHDTWQMDAAEDIPLADGSHACWLRIADEFTGAVLMTAIFPPREMEQRAGRRDPAVPPRGLHGLGHAGANARR